MRKSTLFSFLCLGLSLSIGSSLAESRISGQDLNLSSQQLSSATSGRDMRLEDVVVDGRVAAGHNLDCERCSISGNISVGHDLQLLQCERVNAIASGHDANVSHTSVQSGMAVGNNLTLDHATLESGAHVGNQVLATESTVKGPLSLKGNLLKLDHSTTGAITFAKPSETLMNTSITDTMNSTVVVRHSGFSNVHVGPNSLTSLNGYTVKGAAEQTTLITPEQTIYVNGAKVSGEGPKTYALYRQAHTDAPNIQGPGWMDSPAGTSEKTSLDHKREHKGHAQHAENSNPSQAAVNTLELTNQSRVDGDVVFESGYGKVILHPGCELNGKIVNGRLEHAVD